MDNIVVSKSKATTSYTTNRFMAATVSAGLCSRQSISDGIEAMEQIRAKV
jgi:HAE1 family hydrophobic/amphiphilic exporter-1/multidrug efflux pump